MYSCFKCYPTFSSVYQLILHLKIYYNFGTQWLYSCRQSGCLKNFRRSEKFEQHLHRAYIRFSHSFEVENESSSSKLPT